GATAASYSDHRCDDRHFELRHLPQGVCDGFGLPPLFGVNSRVGAVGIDQRENRAAKLLRELHDAKRFAVTLGVRRAEITVDALFHVASLLRADHKNFLAVEARHAANYGGIVAKAAIAVDLAEVGEEALHVVERLGTLG